MNIATMRKPGVGTLQTRPTQNVKTDPPPEEAKSVSATDSIDAIQFADIKAAQSPFLDPALQLALATAWTVSQDPSLAVSLSFSHTSDYNATTGDLTFDPNSASYPVKMSGWKDGQSVFGNLTMSPHILHPQWSTHSLDGTPSRDVIEFKERPYMEGGIILEGKLENVRTELFVTPPTQEDQSFTVSGRLGESHFRTRTELGPEFEDSGDITGRTLITTLGSLNGQPITKSYTADVEENQNEDGWTMQFSGGGQSLGSRQMFNAVLSVKEKRT